LAAVAILISVFFFSFLLSFYGKKNAKEMIIVRVKWILKRFIKVRGGELGSKCFKR